MEQSVTFPKTTRGQKTFQAILSAAENLFFEKGYHQTNISEITQSAGVALGTFYIYFKDKFSLYHYLQQHYYHEIRASIAEALKGIDDRLEMERQGLKAFLKYAQKYPHTYNILWEALYIDKRLFEEYYENFAKRYIRSLQQQGESGTVTGADYEILAWALMGIANFVGLKYVLFQDTTEEELDQVVDSVIKLLRGEVFQTGKKEKS